MVNRWIALITMVIMTIIVKGSEHSVNFAPEHSVMRTMMMMMRTMMMIMILMIMMMFIMVFSDSSNMKKHIIANHVLTTIGLVSSS